MSFPLRTKDKGSSWNSRYDDVFDNYIDVSTLDSNNLWPHTGPSISSFDELFEDLHDSSSQRTHSSVTSDIKLLTEPHPSYQVADDFWTKTLRSLESTESKPLPHSQPLLAKNALSLDDRQHFDCFGFPSPPYVTNPLPQIEESRGRTRTGAQQGSIKRTRNPSGVRKSLRHAKSTPNMMNASRYRPDLEDLLRNSQKAHPPVPVIDKKWNSRHPPSPPTSTETNDPFMPAPGMKYELPGSEPFPHSQNFVNPFVASSPTMHTPLASPRVDNYFSHPSSGVWNNNFNDHAVAFNACALDAYNPFQERSKSFIDLNVPTPPSFNPWTKANSTPPPPLTLNASALRNVAPQAVMSAPPLKPGQFGFGIPSSYTASSIMRQNATLMSDASISPRTSTFPNPTMNFSLPYRSQQTQSPQRHERTHQAIRPAHVRTTSEVPIQQGDDLSSRRTRSSSRPRSSRHHRRTKSGPGQGTVEAAVPRTPRRREGGRSGPLGGFVNFTPSDSQKLLTGVAPSGSSKTKARREKEAHEKRRKLSQAAVKAVREGDLDALREAGLVVEE
ncbi:hypothetical protein B9Z65_833 [Elsinoe australis]|uniref:Uncharacterized protein n=1 Tax=Elsinoe australis TaxID=40998 RepID=A0A2P8AJM7_9PEZI|nr:hypothetical protein B9Z65_833 [Elsinoe australis]